MTLRQASGKIRKILSPYKCKVTGRTVSFAGLGFESSWFIDISCEETLPKEAILSLENAKNDLEFSKNRLIMSLVGPAYPFGAKI